MADPGLVKSMVADGWAKEAAVEQIDAVVGAMKSHLLTGKLVRLEGLGTLRAPRKAVRAGFPPKHLREQRKVEFRDGAMIEKGDPYPDPRIPPSQSLTAGE